MDDSRREIGLTSVIVVAADSGPLLATCMTAALASTANIEIIVIDNASSDGEPQRARVLYAQDARVRVVTLDRNIGFGPACNRGAALARGDALLVLNPDCRIEPQTIASLRAICDGDRSIGLLGIDIVSPEGHSARGNRRREPTLRRALMTMSGLARFEARRPALAGIEMPAHAKTSGERVERVEAVSGACMFLPRNVFDRIGGFDEAYFLHVEDLDLCRRVRDAGYAVAIVPTLRAVHEQGGSSRHRPVFVAWHKHRGMWRYFSKFDPASRNPVARFVVWLGIWMHFALKAPFLVARRLISSSAPRADAQGAATRAA